MKKRSAVDQCVRAYQEGLDAYAALEKNIRAAESATADVPLRTIREARAHLAKAFPILSRLGDALTFLPALAIQLTEERRISGTFRRQAKEKGVAYRYDEDEEKEDCFEVGTD